MSGAALIALDAERLILAGSYLDRVARRTEHCTVALHSIAAVEHLTTALGPRAAELAGGGGAPREDDPVLLRAALTQFSRLSPAALRDDDIADALHQALLAHLASR